MGSCSSRTRSPAATARPAIVKPRDRRGHATSCATAAAALEPRTRRQRTRRRRRGSARGEQQVSKLVLDKLQAKFGADSSRPTRDHGDDTALVAPARWRAICRFLRDRPRARLRHVRRPVRRRLPGPRRRGPRLEVVLHLYSIGKRHRVRLKARVGDAEMERRRARQRVRRSGRAPTGSSARSTT